MKRLCGQMILFFVFASLFSTPIFSQDESEARSPLELILSAQSSALCLGSPLMLELDVTNTGQVDVEINKSHFWKSFSYWYSAPNGGLGSGAMARYTDTEEGRLVLHPYESYRTSFEFPLTDNFFQKARAYTLKTYVDQKPSSEIAFDLYDCGKPQEVKEQQ